MCPVTDKLQLSINLEVLRATHLQLLKLLASGEVWWSLTRKMGRQESEYLVNGRVGT